MTLDRSWKSVPARVFAHARALQVAVVLVLFTFLGCWYFRDAVGEDLSSSYVGCRILAAGEGTHLYAHDPLVFSIVRDPIWNRIAERADFAPLSLLHPYVQTPLWAYALEPICTRTHFRRFRQLFLGLAMLSLSGTLWLVARYWAPAIFHPVAMCLVCAGLWFSEPFQYAMFLTQTHILYLFLSVLALVLAQRRQPVLGGFALALAASVKITPAFLLVYWMLSRRYRAALSFVVSSVLLAGLTVVATGPALCLAYLRELNGVSRVLLVAFNNQSLAAWWVGRHYPAWELFDWRIHPLPHAMRLISLTLSLLTGIVGGLMDRSRSPLETGRAPYGAAFTILGSTIFTAIAWSHYYILLVIPIMLLLDALLSRLPLLWGGLVAMIYALNVYPIAYGSILHLHERHSVARSEFYSGVICLFAVALLRWLGAEPREVPVDARSRDLQLRAVL